MELFKCKLVLFFYWLHYSLRLSAVSSEVRLKNNSFLLLLIFFSRLLLLNNIELFFSLLVYLQHLYLFRKMKRFFFYMTQQWRWRRRWRLTTITNTLFFIFNTTIFSFRLFFLNKNLFYSCAFIFMFLVYLNKIVYFLIHSFHHIEKNYSMSFNRYCVYFPFIIW